MTSTGPSRRIFTDADLTHFLSSPAHSRIVGFIEQLAQTVPGQVPPQSTQLTASETSLVLLLDKFELEIEQFPIDPTSRDSARFGDKTFRDWLASISRIVLEGCFNDEETRTYLLGSFGDATRVDFGTGHELNCLVFLLVLVDRGVLQISSRLVLGVFWRYLRLVRSVLTRFRLEPAGSHGVWGLDEYFHLSFLFGAAQLTGSHGHCLSPAALFACSNSNPHSDSSSLFEYALNTVIWSKRTPLQVSAPVLWSISQVETWERVTLGLVRMYLAEVLGKRPVVQHLVFGKVLEWAF